MKVLLRFLLMVVLVSYLFVSFFFLRSYAAEDKCRDLQVEITDSAVLHYISPADVYNYIEDFEMDPCGKPLGGIDTEKMERTLMSNGVLGSVECYKKVGGTVCVEVTQRIPILRVMSANGQNYYLDNKGTIMPPEAKCVAHRVIVTGNVEKSFAMKDLYKFGVFLHNNKFWDAQIEQIHVLPDQNIELVPRVGDHLVYLGKLENFEDKLARLKEFYKKGLNRVGWNKYSRINLEFSNQIICTKRE